MASCVEPHGFRELWGGGGGGEHLQLTTGSFRTKACLPYPVWGGYQNQKEIVALLFGAHMNNLFIIEVKILILIKWSYRFSLNILTIKSSRVIIY